MVGKAGSRIERCGVLTASPFNAPDSICGLALVATPKNICVTLPTVAIMPEFTSRYGAWTMFVPASLLRYSHARCGALPLPAEAQLSFPRPAPADAAPPSAHVAASLV